MSGDKKPFILAMAFLAGCLWISCAKSAELSRPPCKASLESIVKNNGESIEIRYSILQKQLEAALKSDFFSSSYFVIQNSLSEYLKPIIELALEVSLRQISNSSTTKPKALEELETLLFGTNTELKLLEQLNNTLSAKRKGGLISFKTTGEKIADRVRAVVDAGNKLKACRAAIKKCTTDVTVLLSEMNAEYKIVKTVLSVLEDETKILELVLSNTNDWLPVKSGSDSVKKAISNKIQELGQSVSYFTLMADAIEKIMIGADQSASHAGSTQIEGIQRAIIRAGSESPAIDLNFILKERDELKSTYWDININLDQFLPGPDKPANIAASEDNMESAVWDDKYPSWQVLLKLPLNSRQFKILADELGQTESLMRKIELFSLNIGGAPDLLQIVRAIEGFLKSKDVIFKARGKLAVDFLMSRLNHRMENDWIHSRFSGLFQGDVLGQIPLFLGELHPVGTADRARLIITQALMLGPTVMVDFNFMQRMGELAGEGTDSRDLEVKLMWDYLNDPKTRLVAEDYFKLLEVSVNHGATSVWDLCPGGWSNDELKVLPKEFYGPFQGDGYVRLNPIIFFAVKALSKIQILSMDNIPNFRKRAHARLLRIVLQHMPGHKRSSQSYQLGVEKYIDNLLNRTVGQLN